DHFCGFKACLVPGTYTYATFGADRFIGTSDQPKFQFQKLETAHNAPEKAQNMGTLKMGANKSDRDYFTCRDNAVPIGGQAPCAIDGKPATKAIYRQFYLAEAGLLQVSGIHGLDCGTSYGGNIMSLFHGKATDGLAGLKPVGGAFSCIQGNTGSDGCTNLEPGWYTIVSYGSGPSYEHPTRDLGQRRTSSYIGLSDELTLTLSKGCPGPKYNRPWKAAVDSVTKKPFLIEWKAGAGHTSAYPRTDSLYKLHTENFNCTVDTPFHILPACAPNMAKVAYWVFELKQESYVQIRAERFWGAVYAGDVRTADSAKFRTATPVQSCVQNFGKMDICRMQPGLYTLVLFADASINCSSVTPEIYIDRVGYARFDHAAAAYDFGAIPADSAYHNGKVGDVNPLDKDRAPSSDFFYCTTGARSTDPDDGQCRTDLLPGIYSGKPNNAVYDRNNSTDQYSIPRRNLWYTFLVDKPGNIKIKVLPKTPGKKFQPTFSVYRSNVDGTLPWAEVVRRGLVDSTRAQGLTYVETNYRSYCSGRDSITFYREPCNNVPERYYIVVENVNSYPYEYYGVTAASQIDVSILLDSVNAAPTKYDHYYQAYDFGTVSSGGVKKGGEDNYSCATGDATDPTEYYNCTKTLWYKITMAATGNLKYRIRLNGKDIEYNTRSVQLFRQILAGDSTDKGLQFAQGTRIQDANGTYWMQSCVSAGTYYLLLPGCDRIREDVYPEIELLEEAGDYCSKPMVATVNGAGSAGAQVVVDCHTIGTDYGEFGTTLTCPAGVRTTTYKSSWFRIDITGTDTLDVTTLIEENTNAVSGQIKYRMMTGDCGAMQEQSCVQNAQTQNTYECLAPGRSYYIQVLTPVLSGSDPVTGDITLKLTSRKHVGKCAPPAACLAQAQFTTEFDCKKDSAVRFINQSTYGSAMKYTWNFGYAGKTSSETSPAHVFPALKDDRTYTVRLIVENTGCGEKDTTEVQVFVPGRPAVDLGEDRLVCTPGTPVTLKATSHPGATYRWQDGTTQDTYVLTATGTRQLSVEVTYNNCTARDTVLVSLQPMDARLPLAVLLCGGSAVLDADRGGSEQYRWSTGETTASITVTVPGIYWADVSLNGCTVRDSFEVAGTDLLRPLGRDTAFCFGSGALTLDATVSGADAYSWQDGTTTPTYSATKAGIYWVDIRVGTCTVRDSITITGGTPPAVAIAGSPRFCTGDSTLLDAGAGHAAYLWSNGATTQTVWIKSPGTYTVTVTNAAGCSAASTPFPVTEHARPRPAITGNRPLCPGSSLQLDAGAGYATYSWNDGSGDRLLTVTTPGRYIVTVTNSNGCAAKDSADVLAAPAVKREAVTPSFCGSG
ncbi:MAG TPA: hypothetical protein VHK69_18605, partial [Chitinophagaceae bacterium]|nr:hypothetical protein [Chitinophagaceae bacterium]